MADLAQAPAPSKEPALDAAPMPPMPPAAPAPNPGAPNPAPVQEPGADLQHRRLPNRADIQERTAAEYAQKIDPRNSYAIDIMREDGVVVRDQGRFYRTPGNDRAGGGYISGPDGVKYHNTGTTDDGRVLAKHKVDPNGNVTFKPEEKGPRAFTTELNDMFDQLGLTPLEKGGLTFSRRGYSGIYTLQIEKDGSFSVHYGGGRNDCGERCYSQTYHHGDWDYGRTAKLEPKDQQARWTRWQNREQNDSTTVSVAHHEPVAKASSGFHTATSSSTVNEQGKLTAAPAALTTTEHQQAISKITADQSTWSATYIHTPGPQGQPAVIPPSYSFACQQNGVSGVLNIKQATLDGLAADLTVVSDTYSLSVNHYNESLGPDKGYRSLLTDTRMLLRGENGTETIVSLRPNGNVVDHTHNLEYHIQVKDGEPITWVAKPIEAPAAKDPVLDSAPVPSNIPGLNEVIEAAPAPSNIPSLNENEQTTVQKWTAADIEAAKKSNLERAQILAAKLHTENSGSVFQVDPEKKIVIPPEIADRTAAAVGFKSPNETNGAAYVFTRKIGDNPGVVFLREKELSADTSEAAKVVAATYAAKTNTDDQTLKIGEFHQLDPNTKTKIRSDGSVEMHKENGANTEYSIIEPYKKNGGGIQWGVIEGELDSNGDVIKKSVTVPPSSPGQPKEPEPVKEPTSGLTISPEATKMARQIYDSIVPIAIFGDDEELFVSKIEEASKIPGRLKEIDHELKRIFNTYIREIIANEGVGGWTGIGEEHLKRLNEALKDHNEVPKNAYEKPESLGPDYSAGMF